jgi:hypothetical protein
MSDSNPGAILQPQPPPCENEVKRSGVVSGAPICGSAFALTKFVERTYLKQ